MKTINNAYWMAYYAAVNHAYTHSKCAHFAAVTIVNGEIFDINFNDKENHTEINVVSSLGQRLKCLRGGYYPQGK